jgi:hypothetical protein
MCKLIAAVLMLSVMLAASIAALFILIPHTEPDTDASSASAAGARLGLSGDTFDLGNVPGDRTVERTVAFTNTGTEPLEVEIIKVRPAPDAACGCGVEGYEVRPSIVPAGGTGRLVFQLRVPQSMPDMEDIMIAELRTNDSSNIDPRIRLVFRMASEESARDEG